MEEADRRKAIKQHVDAFLAKIPPEPAEEEADEDEGEEEEAPKKKSKCENFR